MTLSRTKDGPLSDNGRGILVYMAHFLSLDLQQPFPFLSLAGNFRPKIY